MPSAILPGKSRYTPFVESIFHVCSSRALTETANFAQKFKQQLPGTVTEEDLLSFDMRREFDLLRTHCPLLFNVVSGAMGLGEGELKVVKALLRFS